MNPNPKAQRAWARNIVKKIKRSNGTKHDPEALRGALAAQLQCMRMLRPDDWHVPVAEALATLCESVAEKEMLLEDILHHGLSSVQQLNKLQAILDEANGNV